MGDVQGEHQGERRPFCQGASAEQDVLLDGVRGNARQAGASLSPTEARELCRAQPRCDGGGGGRSVRDLGHRRVEPLRYRRRRVFRGHRRGVRREGLRGLMATGHYPVMLEETIQALALSGGEMVVDATFGGGGHARRILRELGPDARVVGIDRDPEAAARASRLAEEDGRFAFRAGAYDEVLAEMIGEGFRVGAVLFDLGLSSYQIDKTERGFSYVWEGPLDMRMDPERGEPAAEFLNAADQAEVASVLARYGDVPRGEARRVAREIARRRPLISLRLYGQRSDGRRGAATRRRGSSRPCVCTSTTNWAVCRGPW